jgi:acyl-coenzyme A synthetase/AMP-(fatty) acid ligase
VLLCADLHPEILLVFWAASRLGIVLVPVSPREAKPRIKEYIRLLKPSLAFVQPALQKFFQSAGCNSIMLDLINEPVYDSAISFENWLSNCPDTVLPENINLTGDDIAVILWTTGSTGNPKGIPLTHGQLIRSGRCMTETYHWKKTDRYLAVGGLETMSGLRHATVASAETGACCIIPEDNNIYQYTKTILDEKITILSANPIFYRQLLTRAKTDENLFPANHLIRLALCTGNTLPEELRTKWQEQTGIQLMNYYGLTETSGLCIAEPNGFSPSADHSIGFPVDCLIKIIDKSGNPVKTGGFEYSPVQLMALRREFFVQAAGALTAAAIIPDLRAIAAAVAGYKKVIALAGYDGTNPLCVAAREALDALVQKVPTPSLQARHP